MIFAYLKDLEKFLFFENCIFQVDGNFLLLCLLKLHHIAFIFKFVAKAIHVVKTVHHLESACISELTFHEKLRVFAALGPKFNLSLIQRFKISGELRLALVTVEGTACILTFTLLHTSLTALLGWLFSHGRCDLAWSESGLLLDGARFAA